MHVPTFPLQKPCFTGHREKMVDIVKTISAVQTSEALVQLCKYISTGAEKNVA